jgi:hypothetical protein
MVDLLYVIGNELEVARLKVDNMNKEKKYICTKMEHVKVVYESMISTKDEKEKNFQVL